MRYKKQESVHMITMQISIRNLNRCNKSLTYKQKQKQIQENTNKFINKNKYFLPNFSTVVLIEFNINHWIRLTFDRQICILLGLVGIPEHCWIK